jgi:hypothetical protein
MDTGRRYPFSACGKLPIDCSIILCTYLAKIGLTPEEFDERVREFGRKFFREQE